jgi:enediyne biosynthesis protein E4
MPKTYLFLFATLFLFACTKSKDGQLFEKVENSGIQFTNTVTDEKDNNIFKYRNFYNGGGVGIGDINNDGLADVFFTANQGANKLFLNKGDFKFEDISDKAGFSKKDQWSTGVTMVDINNDGWLDIYVANAGNMMQEDLRKNQLFINNHDLTFTDSAEAYGLANNGYTTHASFFDYDMDGDLDCFMVNNSPIPVNTLNYANARDIRAENSAVADFLKGGGDHLYKNEGGKFVEVSAEAGIHGSLISFGLGVTIGDVNGDAWPDVYVSNDFFERDYLYINQKNGTFKDEIETYTEHNSIASMGTDMADVNNDGYPDIFTTEMLPDNDFRLKTTTSFDNIDIYRLKVASGFYHQFMHNALQLNNKNGKYKEVARFSGVEASDWSWGEMIFDADNDGYNDIYVSNGIYRDLTNQDFIDFFANTMIQKMVLSGKKDEISSIIEKMSSQPIPNKMFRNNGDLTFKDMGKDWGLDIPSFSNGAAYGDLDNDGDLDMVVNNNNMPSFVFKNKSREKNKNGYIGFKLKGLPENINAVGAKINVFIQGQILSKEVIPARGFQSSVDYKQIFGLGQFKKIDSVQVIWPNLTQSILKIQKLDTVYTIDQATQIVKPFVVQQEKVAPLFEEVKANFEKHTEDDHVDFYAERIIPRILSQEGPKATTADINGDGLVDLFIGGANNKGSQIYLQTSNGDFKPKPQTAFNAFTSYEDVAAVFFDADKDGDMDLLVGSGGNNRLSNRGELNHRLFLNDGKANFTHFADAFPVFEYNTGVMVPMDYDLDGDLDVFVGARNTPLKYGVTPSSALYQNDGSGKFKDVTSTIAPDFLKLGMVTSAVWGKITSKQSSSLIVVGDYMYPVIYAFEKGKMVEQASNLNGMSGWWQSIQMADIDGDGFQDLIIGNMGENGYLKPTQQRRLNFGSMILMVMRVSIKF